MACCGKKRAQACQLSQSAVRPITTTPLQAAQDGKVYFQYLGENGLTVVGPVSQKHYRFDRQGSVAVVDPRDKQALAGVSMLRPVRRVTNVREEP